MAQRLNKLENRGLVTRQANPGDGRGKLVALTDAGRDLIETALPNHLETELAITAALNDEEQTVLADLLQRISTAASICIK
ncbi:MarR family winged helix-turn-helix transcriptional regulator [Cryobacterium sp. M15]|uniref:MarR family winged helix-turn-helix transcriptional regulator n=1 Tax=Cryobacterium sp. M15 TaxID=2048291 RepID=UPI000CE2F7AB|nr:winged helix DNA-binding protein [Cryobacterium sp. M15]